MNLKRNIRKSSLRRKRVIVGFVLLLAVAALAGYLRFKRGPNADFGEKAPPEEPSPSPLAPTAKRASDPSLPAEENLPAADGEATVSDEFVDEFTYLARTDPRAAADLLARLNEGAERDEKLAVLLEAWSESDPRAAAAWVGALPAGEFLDDATGQLMIRWGATDPKAAAAWVDANIESGRKPSGAATFASAWTRADPEAAIEWAGAIEDEAARKEAYGAIAYQLGLDAPARAGAWIATVEDPALQDALATGLVSTWASKDPAAAAAWLETGGLANASEAIRRKAALMLVSRWTNDDPRPASMWINALPEGAMKENAKVSLAQTLSVEAPGDALIWADSIADETERRDVALSIYEDWVEGDPADFKKQLVQRWSTITDPKVREGIYGLLYNYDPAFRDEVVQLIEKAVTE